MDGPPRIERVARPWQVEGSTPKPPLEVRISRAFLSLAILLLVGSIFFFLYHFLSPPDGFRSGAAFLTKEISIGFFYLSVLFFAIWTLLWTVRVLWLKVRQRSQN